MKQQFFGIQILRFIAAMLVVVMHTSQAISIHITGQGAGHYWSSGSAGVDIFFVVSGFVMAMSVGTPVLDVQARKRAALIFMKRRLLRIVPLYWFYTLLKVALILALPGLATRSSVDSAHLAASLFFIPAMSPWGLIEPTLPVGWTLNFEMLFYVVFALAIALGAPRIKFCLLIFLLIFFGSRYFPNSVPINFYARSIVFEFIFGICIAQAISRFQAITPVSGGVILVGGLVLMFGLNWNPLTDRLLMWGLGAALLVSGAVALEPWTAKVPLISPLAFLGDASYSIYLSHTFMVPAGVMAMKRLGVQDPFVIVSLVCLAVIASGCLSYIWLERPMTVFFKNILFKTPAIIPRPWKHKHEK